MADETEPKPGAVERRKRFKAIAGTRTVYCLSPSLSSNSLIANSVPSCLKTFRRARVRVMFGWASSTPPYSPCPMR